MGKKRFFERVPFFIPWFGFRVISSRNDRRDKLGPFSTGVEAQLKYAINKSFKILEEKTSCTLYPFANCVHLYPALYNFQSF
jgi:hypothetical protein